MIGRAAAAALLLTACSALNDDFPKPASTAAPLVSDPYPGIMPVVTGPNLKQYFPALASAGGGALVVMNEETDTVHGLGGSQLCRENATVFLPDGGTRVLGALGPPFGTCVGLITTRPSVDPLGYLLFGDGLTALRVSVDGTVSPLGPLMPGQTYFKVAFDGTHHLVVWSGPGDGGADILGVRVSPAGQLVGGVQTVVSTTAIENPETFATAPGELLLVWSTNASGTSRLFGSRIVNAASLDPNGILLDTMAGGYQPITAAFDGQDFVVAWAHTGVGPVYAKRVSLDGGVLDATPTLVTNGGFLPTLGGGAGTSVCLFEGVGATPTVVRMRGGVVLDSPPIVFAPPGSYTLGFDTKGVVFDGTRFRIAWRRNTDSNATHGFIQLRELELDGSIPGPIVIARPVLNEQRHPDLAFGSGVYLLVWADHVADSDDVYGLRLSPEGVPLDAQPFKVGVSTVLDSYPRVSAGPGLFAVAWERSTTGQASMVAARVDPDGGVLDPAGIVVASALSYPSFGAEGPGPAVAFGATDFAVSYAVVTSSFYAGRVATDGTPKGPAAPLSVLGSAWASALAFDGTQYLAVFADGTPSASLRATRVALDGGRLDPADLVLGGVSTYDFPAAAAGGQQFVVAWSRGIDGFAVRIAPDGGTLAPAKIVFQTGGNALDPPGLAYDGAQWHIAWAERGTQALTLDTYDSQLNLLTREDAGTGLEPRLAYSAPGEGMLAYVQQTDPYGPKRLKLARVCSSPPCVAAIVDAGVDAGVADGGATDAGFPDAGAQDAGGPDAGAADAGGSDAGADAGEADAGHVDAGDRDAGRGDAGPDEAQGPRALEAGCGCGAGPGFVPLALLALGALKRRGRGVAQRLSRASSRRCATMPPTTTSRFSWRTEK